ncbi:DUF2809 domain-containing protein [Candidatus Halobeggiatoa sp. HSG11]|nr:DUF2809 domain-containing protein [Candidatus Halobeggiatoa sp. HSG11]
MNLIHRNRIVYALAIITVIVLGLASRRYSLPYFIVTYAGDTLWALMVFFIIGFLFPTLSTIKVIIIALSFSFCIELSQLYHEPWIDNIRQNRLVALIIGHVFLWSDLICYTVGIIIGGLIELMVSTTFLSIDLHD